MRLFKCQHCGQLLYFENNSCERCHHPLGFSPEKMDLITMVQDAEPTYHHVLPPYAQFRYCKNAVYEVCNWIIDNEDPGDYCKACRLNRTIPNLDNPDHLISWRKIEFEKHRLVYTLLMLGIPVLEKSASRPDGLAFDFLSQSDSVEKIVMGHSRGLITIAVSEADDVKRMKTKEELGEPYRTVLGHFRHEIGHHYWEQLVFPYPARLTAFREVFGDEQADYSFALKEYYQTGASANWQENFVSAYATAHPWEDWAETWAHYLHIVDALETASAFGLRVNPEILSRKEMLVAEYSKSPFHEKNFDQLMNLWIPLTAALNTLNRSMGQPDFYPFVVSGQVIKKLSFIHKLIHNLKLEPSERFGS